MKIYSNYYIFYIINTVQIKTLKVQNFNLLKKIFFFLGWSFSR